MVHRAGMPSSVASRFISPRYAFTRCALCRSARRLSATETAGVCAGSFGRHVFSTKVSLAADCTCWATWRNGRRLSSLLSAQVLRQQRNLGPPAVGSRNAQWRDLMADLYMQQMLFGGSPPAVLLDTYSLTAGSTLSAATGRRLKHLTCRIQVGQRFTAFSAVFRSLFSDPDSEDAVASASETWSRLAHLFCVHEEQFLHLCTAGQAELEYLAHAVAEIDILEPQRGQTDQAKACYLSWGKGINAEGAYMPVFLSFLFRLCLVHLGPCLSTVNLLKDVGKLALWRRAQTSEHLTGEGIFLPALDSVAYPTSDPDRTS